MTAVEYVREICKQRGIPVSKLEADCKFANGYLNPKKQRKIEPDRAAAIGAYLQIPVEEILSRNMTSAQLLAAAQSFLEKSDQEMMDLLTAQGAAISGPEDFQDLKDGIREVEDFRTLLRRVCQANGLSQALMIRLGFSPQETPQPARRPASDEEVKLALFGDDSQVTDAMYEEVKRYAKMVKLWEETEKAP